MNNGIFDMLIINNGEEIIKSFANMENQREIVFLGKGEYFFKESDLGLPVVRLVVVV